MTIEEKVRFWQGRFAILKAWSIRIGNGHLSGQVTTSPDEPKAIFHPWKPEGTEPEDFYFHEMLHVALRAYKRIPEADDFDAEEILIRDICAVYLEVPRGRV